jgi:hypothetical protein
MGVTGFKDPVARRKDTISTEFVIRSIPDEELRKSVLKKDRLNEACASASFPR